MHFKFSSVKYRIFPYHFAFDLVFIFGIYVFVRNA